MAIWFSRELEEVVRALNDAGLEYALIGGLALAIYGVPRATQDIDFLIHTDDAAAIEGVLRSLGYAEQGRIETLRREIPFARFGQLIPVGAAKRMLFVDLLKVSPMVEDVWQTRRRKNWRGHELGIVSLNGLVELKTIAGRPRDWADIERLNEVHNGDVDE